MPRTTAPARDARTLLRRLERIHRLYGDEHGPPKLELLRGLDRRRLKKASEVARLHEVLCFLRAYPDDRDVLRQVRTMLDTFARRTDLRRVADELADSGIAGTSIYYSFYWHTALWLARRWPDRLDIDWGGLEDEGRLDGLLVRLVPYAETLALDEADLSTRAWVDLLKGPGETDATFVLRRLAAVPGDDFTREALHEDLDLSLRLSPGPGTPSRTEAHHPGTQVAFQARPLDRARPDLREEIRRPPLAVRAVSAREGARLIELVRGAMITRSRDLYAFRNADPHDVRMVDCGDGLQFAAIGVVPERRLVLDSVYGYLTLKNGVPIGYVLTSAYFNSAEVAYNVFETFRGAEAARVYGRVLAMVHHLFDVDVFTVDPYQLGDDNPEALESGAWWFYYKLGFRPEDAGVRRVLRRELDAMRRDPGHRSGIPTLRKLAAANVFLYLGRPRRDVRGIIPLDNIGVQVSRYLARRFGADREAGLGTCAREAARLCGVRSTGATPGERLAWERWSPLMLSLPGVERWPAADRRELARVALAKGGRRESDFVRRLDRHRRLRRALLRMAARGYDGEG